MNNKEFEKFLTDNLLIIPDGGGGFRFKVIDSGGSLGSVSIPSVGRDWDFEIVTGPYTLSDQYKSLSISNLGDNPATVNGKSLPAGVTINIGQSLNDYFDNDVVMVATGTTLLVVWTF